MINMDLNGIIKEKLGHEQFPQLKIDGETIIFVYVEYT